MKPKCDWTVTMHMVSAIDTRVLPNRAARHLLLLLSTYANEDGVAWPGMTRLAREMGYRLAPDGRLTKPARGTLTRVLGILEKRGLVERTDCRCKKERHELHFQLDIRAIASSRTAAQTAAELQPTGSRTADSIGSNSADGAAAELLPQVITPVTTTPSQATPPERQSPTSSQPPSGSVKARLAGESSIKSAIDSDGTAAADEEPL